MVMWYSLSVAGCKSRISSSSNKCSSSRRRDRRCGSIWMQERDVGIPIRGGACAETEAVIFGKTKIISGSLVHKRECAVWLCVTCKGWNYIERGLQLRFKRRVLMKGSVGVEAGNSHSLVPPLS